MEYIEREAALAFQNELEPVICKSVHSGGVYSATRDDDLVRFLSAIPAADVRPVVHGRWRKAKTFDIDRAYECSICGDTPFYDEIEKFNYCRRCGARMDGDGE